MVLSERGTTPAREFVRYKNPSEEQKKFRRAEAVKSIYDTSVDWLKKLTSNQLKTQNHRLILSKAKEFWQQNNFTTSEIASCLSRFDMAVRSLRKEKEKERQLAPS